MWAAQPAQEAIAEDDCPAEISELGCGEWAAAVAALEAMYAEDDLVGGTLETDVEWPAAADRRLAKMSELPETDADRKEWLVHWQSQLDGECEDFNDATESGDHMASGSAAEADCEIAPKGVLAPESDDTISLHQIGAVPAECHKNLKDSPSLFIGNDAGQNIMRKRLAATVNPEGDFTIQASNARKRKLRKKATDFKSVQEMSEAKAVTQVAKPKAKTRTTGAGAKRRAAKQRAKANKLKAQVEEDMEQMTDHCAEASGSLAESSCVTEMPVSVTEDVQWYLMGIGKLQAEASQTPPPCRWMLRPGQSAGQPVAPPPRGRGESIMEVSGRVAPSSKAKSLAAKCPVSWQT